MVAVRLKDRIEGVVQGLIERPSKEPRLERSSFARWGMSRCVAGNKRGPGWVLFVVIRLSVRLALKQVTAVTCAGCLSADGAWP